MAVAEDSARAVRLHSPLERVLLCVLGLVIAAGGWGSGFLLLRLSSWGGSPSRLAGLLVALVVLWAIGTYGAWLVARGVTGRSRMTALDRASESVARGLTELSVPLSMAVGACFWAALSGRPPPSIVPGAIWFVSVGALGFPVWIALHELGHLVAATAQGRRIMEVRAWPLRLSRRTEGGLRASAFWRIRDGRAGLVLAVPAQSLEPGQRRGWDSRRK